VYDILPKTQKNKQQICFENGISFMKVGSVERAKFIIYARGKDRYIIRVPKSEIVVKRAVRKYETYLKET